MRAVAWPRRRRFGLETHDGTTALCTALRMRGTKLYCAYASGHLRIFDLVSCTLSVSITAHARAINAIEVHSDGETFATAAEDSLVGVWALRGAGSGAEKAEHLGSIAVEHGQLTGVAFCGGFDGTHVAATAYDQSAIHAWRLD